MRIFFLTSLISPIGLLISFTLAACGVESTAEHPREQTSLREASTAAPSQHQFEPSTLHHPVAFSDIIGASDAKDALQEFLRQLKDDTGTQNLGARPAHGILLTGSPGVGKTLLARATAHASNLPFFVTSGADLVEHGAGGESPVERLHRLFTAARERAPSIIFIDELDVLQYSYNMSKQLGIEMDGFSGESQVYVIAAVNSLEGLQESLRRSGHFDHTIVVPPPDQKARIQLLQQATLNSPQSHDVNFESLAALTAGMSGADLVNLANLSAARAARDHQTAVRAEDWDEAYDDVTLGPVNPKYTLDGEAARRTAVHEAGHTAVSLLLNDEVQIRKVTIVPRGKTAGHTAYLQPEDKGSEDIDSLSRHIAAGLGGRAAELLVFGQTSSGASDDLNSATSYARIMVTAWGMGEQVGPLGISKINDPAYTKTYSDATKQQVDADIQKIIQEAELLAVSLLKKHRNQFDLLSDTLLRCHQLSGAEARATLDGRPPQRCL